ncbi:TonB-dependent receptor [Carboxylicivirga sp. RSCT41]|uniref:TonB-dependent receptor n=1 Tax=Carboxylicivirga agarovorans TaxID=3417570 RepID=UPI003D334D27
MKKKQKPWVWDNYTLKRELRIMKAMIVLLMMTFVQAYSATTYSQEKHVNLKLRQASLLEVIAEIEKQSDYTFFFSPKSIDVEKTISIDIQEKNMNAVLEEIFGNSGVVYRIIDNQVILTAPNNAKVSANTQQTITVTGIVTDQSGEPLPGVTVAIKGTTTGTITGIDGTYSLPNVEEGTVLVFSFIGFEKQEIQAAGRTSINITLVEEFTDLNEVVVVGYGTKKKVNLTGAVATIDGEALESRPTENILKSLQGTVPGVTIIDRPDGAQISIRGRGTFAGASSPLYIVDGIEVSSDFFNNLDPTIVENISFLKDAASASIYGAKAAYGVVLVTTKQGVSEALNVSYNGSYGAQKATYIPAVLNSAQYAEMYRTSELNSGIEEANLRYSLDDIQKYRDGSDPDLYPNSNWFDMVLEPSAMFTKHSLNLSGGSEKVQYIFGLGYQRDESLTPGSATDRYNFLSKTSADLKDWLTVSTNVNFIYKKYDNSMGGVSLTEFLRVPPTQVGRHTNGNWGSVRDFRQATAEEIGYNPLRRLHTRGRNNNDTRHFLGNVNAILKPFDGFKFTNQLAYNYYDYRSFSFQNTLEGVPSYINPNDTPIAGSDVNEMKNYWSYSEKLIYDGWINYDKVINSVHNIGIMAGMHADSWHSKHLDVGRKMFPSNEMNAIDGGSTDPDNQLTTYGSFNEETSLSYFGRATYDYKGRYLVEANFRADASSRFANVGKWGYFPSFSAGWRLSEESFMSGFTWLDNLKVRASWGKNGNIRNVGLYDTYDTFSGAGTVYNGGAVLPILVEGRIANPTLTWEKTTTTDIGFDMSINKGLIGLTFDYYARITDDILVEQTDILPETGISNLPYKNVGKVNNSGIELALTHQKSFGDFSYNVGFNMAYIKNEITDLGDGIDKLPPSGYWINQVGHAIGSFYMYEADGLYSTDDIANGDVVEFGGYDIEAGMVKLVDQDGDGEITADDRTIVGSDVPDFTYGINIDLSYKGFTLSALGQGISGVKVYMDNEASQAFFNSSVPREWQLDNWTPDNQEARYPKLFKENDLRYQYNSIQSSYWLFNADYFRIKNITLGYDLPKSLVSSIGLEKVRVFVSGDNMFTIRGDKRMEDFDPERSSGRGAQLGMKTYTGGVSVTF